MDLPMIFPNPSLTKHAPSRCQSYSNFLRAIFSKLKPWFDPRVHGLSQCSFFKPGGVVSIVSHSLSRLWFPMGIPTTFIFRGYKSYNPYIGGLKPSFFMVLGSNGWNTPGGDPKDFKVLCFVCSCFTFCHSKCRLSNRNFANWHYLICKRSDGRETSTISLNWQGNDCMYCM